MSRDALTVVRRELRDQLRQRVDARGLAAAPPTERRLRVREEAMAVLRERGAILPASDLARVVNQVSDDVVGFGPIEFLLKDPSVTEVMVNGPDDVFVEREGRLERVPDRLFEGEEPILHLIERIVGPLGLRVDQASPWVDARLPDGSRVHTGSSRALFLPQHQGSSRVQPPANSHRPPLPAVRLVLHAARGHPGGPVRGCLTSRGPAYVLDCRCRLETRLLSSTVTTATA
jgi:hypothetical protein